MPGPVPKPTELRQRTNKASTRATLTPVMKDGAAAPDLPLVVPAGGGWHERVTEWWRKAWQSPMAAQWTESDVEGLYIVAVLRDNFWKVAPRDQLSFASEIRLQEQRFGLSPLDRRRLEWEIAKAEEANDKAVQRTRGRAAAATARNDPRRGLEAVK